MQIDFFNPRSIVCFIAILQGLVFAVLLGARAARRRSVADVWLALLLVALCSALVTPMIGFANVYDLNQWLTYWPFSIAYSYGALVRLYTVTLTDARRDFRRGDLLLFVPSALYVAFRLYLFAHDLDWKDWFNDNYQIYYNGFVVVTEFVWNVAQLAVSIRHYRRYRAWLDENYSDAERLKFDWLRTFLYVFTSVLVLGAVFDFTSQFVARLSYIQFFWFELVLALTTYALAVAGYLRSHDIEPLFADEPAPKMRVAAAAAGGADFERLKARVAASMTDEKAFLDPNLTLADLARRLGVNASALSHAINAGFGRNFNDFVNEHRVGEVKRRLAEGAADGSTLLAVALDCGFNSKATFNRAFRKFTGAAPKEFQESAATAGAPTNA